MPNLNRTLTLRDLTLQNVAAIVGFSSLALSAQFGWSSLSLNLLVLVFFVLPAILMILDLSLRLPGEGGFYIWTKKAFGKWHGFIAAWSYWLSNLVWFPSVMIAILTVGRYLLWPDPNPDQPVAMLIVGLLILWSVVGINILGLQKAKWIQNVGGMATALTILLLTLLGLYFGWETGSVRPFSASELIPDPDRLELLPFFAAITFTWAGIELAPVIAGEVKNPQKTIPKALIISSIIITLIYCLGTVSLLITLPQGAIDEILGVPQAFGSIGEQLGMDWISAPATLLVILSFLGLFAAWMTGNARIPFVIGLDHFLPPVLGKIHSRYRTPYVSLLVQGVLISLLLTGAMAGSTIKEAFLILVDMSIILFFIPFLYMFAAFATHQKRNTGDQKLRWLINKKWLALAASGSGLTITLLTITLAMIPSQSIQTPWLYYTKVIGGSVLLMGLGMVFYRYSLTKNTVKH